MSYQFNNPVFLGSLGGGVGETDPGAVQNHYAFADTANVHVDDEAHTNLVTNGTPTVTAGVAIFDSAADYLTAANLVTGAFTVTCKARIDGTWANPFGFTVWSVAEATEHIGLSLRTADPGEFRMQLDSYDDDDGSTRIRQLSTDLVFDKSTLAFIGFSFSPDSGMLYQLDGVQRQLSEFIPNNAAAWTSFQLGGGNIGSGETGELEDVRVWDSALAADELNYVYNNL